jgi:hypothetical protein
MDQLPMPSDVKRDADAARAAGPASQTAVEPPSIKLIVRLFVIPLLIVAAAVGVMALISMLAGSSASMEDAIARLKSPGGARTAEWLVGPGSKQRYLDAQALVNEMKSGLDEPERVKLTADLIDILDNHTRPDEGEVQHFVLLALARTWQLDPSQPPVRSADAAAARKRVVDALLRYADAKEVTTRKAAVLATVYLAGREESAAVIPFLASKVSDGREDLDVRIAAATALGPLAGAGDASVTAALQSAMSDTDPRNLELVWSAALSLAQLNQPDVADTVLLLLSRDELGGVRVYDRETDSKNPIFRPLSEQEVERILINTMIGASKLKVPAVQEQIRKLAETDPSARVRASGKQILSSGRTDEPKR